MRLYLIGIGIGLYGIYKGRPIYGLSSEKTCLVCILVYLLSPFLPVHFVSSIQ